MDGEKKKIKFYLKELQEIDVRLSGKEGFPIDYQIRLVIPHPDVKNGSISFEWYLFPIAQSLIPFHQIIYSRINEIESNCIIIVFSSFIGITFISVELVLPH